MTLIVIEKTSNGYVAKVTDTVARINNEQPKTNPKVVENYLNRLIERKEQVSL